MFAAFQLAGPGNQRDWQIIAKSCRTNLEDGQVEALFSLRLASIKLAMCQAACEKIACIWLAIPEIRERRLSDGKQLIWVLQTGRAGDNAQVLEIARRLGGNTVIKKLAFNALHNLAELDVGGAPCQPCAGGTAADRAAMAQSGYRCRQAHGAGGALDKGGFRRAGETGSNWPPTGGAHAF